VAALPGTVSPPQEEQFACRPGHEQSGHWACSDLDKEKANVYVAVQLSLETEQANRLLMQRPVWLRSGVQDRP